MEVKEVLEYELIVRDKNGKIIYHKSGKSKSYVANYNKLIYAFMGNSVNVTDTGGTSITVSTADLANNDVKAIEGDDNYGILFGTGTTAPAPGDYKLESKISHGDGDNLLHYYATSCTAPTTEGTTTYFTVERSAKNNGTVDITINEVGLVLKVVVGGTPKYVLIARDVLTSPPTLTPGSTLTFRYKPQITT